MPEIDLLQPTERADLIVAASRAFAGWLRMNQRMGMRRRKAIIRASERTALCFGVDPIADAGGLEALEDLGGVPHGLRASGQHPDDLLDRGSGSPMQFADAWSSGAFAVPFSPCLSEDLFDLYRAWCRKRAFSHESLQNLVQVMVRLYLFRAVRKRYSAPGWQTNLRSFLLPADAMAPEGQTESAWLGQCVETFRAAAAAFAAAA